MLKEATIHPPQIESDQKQETKISVSRNVLYVFFKWSMLTACFFVSLWCISSLINLAGNYWFKPEMAHLEVPAMPIASDEMGLSLQEVMAQNEIKSLRNFRYVDMDGKRYFQIKDTYNRLQYFDATTGEKLENGDQLYAEYLGRYFSGNYTAAVTSELVERFNQEYTEDNRLLPVYKIIFYNDDALDIYVETEQSRLAAASTYTQRVFRKTSHYFPNYLFGGIPPYSWVAAGFLFLFVLTAFTGLYLLGFRWHQFQEVYSSQKNQPIPNSKRAFGLLASLGLLVFSLIGGLHLFAASYQDDSLRFIKNSVFKVEELNINTSALPWEKTGAFNASIVGMPQGVFYQMFSKNENNELNTDYFNAETGERLPEGDFVYTRYLANKFKAHKAKIDAGVSFSCCIPPDTIPDGTQLKEAGIINTTTISTFNDEYDLSYKRLPVVKIEYDGPINLTYFVEAAASRQAVRTTQLSQHEARLSAIFHVDQLTNQPGNTAGTVGCIFIFLCIMTFAMAEAILLARV